MTTKLDEVALEASEAAAKALYAVDRQSHDPKWERLDEGIRNAFRRGAQATIAAYKAAKQKAAPGGDEVRRALDAIEAERAKVIPGDGYDYYSGVEFGLREAFRVVRILSASGSAAQPVKEAWLKSWSNGDGNIYREYAGGRVERITVPKPDEPVGVMREEAEALCKSLTYAAEVLDNRGHTRFSVRVLEAKAHIQAQAAEIERLTKDLGAWGYYSDEARQEARDAWDALNARIRELEAAQGTGEGYRKTLESLRGILGSFTWRSHLAAVTVVNEALAALAAPQPPAPSPAPQAGKEDGDGN